MLLIQGISGLEHMVNRPGCFSISKVGSALGTGHMLTILQQSGFDFKFVGEEEEEVRSIITPTLNVRRTLYTPPMEVIRPDGVEMVISWEDIPRLFHEYEGPFVIETHFKQKLYRRKFEFPDSWPRVEIKGLIKGMVFNVGSLQFTVFDTVPGIYRQDSLILNNFDVGVEGIFLGLFDRKFNLRQICDVLWIDNEDYTLKTFENRIKKLKKEEDKLNFSTPTFTKRRGEVVVFDPDKPYVSFGGQWIVSRRTTPKVFLPRVGTEMMVLGEKGYPVMLTKGEIFNPYYVAEVLIEKVRPFKVKRVLTKKEFSYYYDYRGINIYRFMRRFV